MASGFPSEGSPGGVVVSSRNKGRGGVFLGIRGNWQGKCKTIAILANPRPNYETTRGVPQGELRSMPPRQLRRTQAAGQVDCTNNQEMESSGMRILANGSGNRVEEGLHFLMLSTPVSNRGRVDSVGSRGVTTARVKGSRNGSFKCAFQIEPLLRTTRVTSGQPMKRYSYMIRLMD